MNVREYLYRKNFQFTEKNRGGSVEAILNCPFCGDKEKKFAVNLESGAYNCLHLNNCGVNGSFWQLQKSLGDEPERIVGMDRAFVSRPAKKYKRPTPAPESRLVDEHLQYLLSRGFTPSIINKFKLYSQNGSIAIPFFKGGELVNVKYRPLVGKDMHQEKEAEPCLYNRDAVKTDELVIVEGEYDAMAMAEYGMNVVSVPSGASDMRWIDTEWEWLEKFRMIYLGMDNDAAGYAGMMELVTKLGAWRCKGITWPKKDPNDCLMAKVTKAEMWDCIAAARDFPPAILVTADYFTDRVVDLFANPDKLNGTPTAWEPLNRLIKGWRTEELTVWSGRNGSGKSTILNQHMLDLAKRNVKSCVASLEMPGAQYLRWAVMQHTGQANPGKREIVDALEWMTDRIYVVNTHEEIDEKTLLEVFEYAARRYNVKHFVVDSLTRMRFAGKEELKEHKSFVSSLLSFVKKHKVHLHLVAHPRKGATDDTIPEKVDIMGTGNITDLAHNVIMMWRVSEKEKQDKADASKPSPDAIMYVRKNREFGLEGGIRLSFDPQTKVFKEYDS